MRAGRPPLILLSLFLLGCGAGLAQESLDFPIPNDFSQEPLLTRAAEVSQAWNKWTRDTKGLEERVFRLPMVEARELVQKGLAEYLDFLDRIRSYGQSVASYIEKLHTEPRSRAPIVSAAVVYQDQVLLLGVNLGRLQAALKDLRDSPEWLPIRRGIQKEADELLKLQGTRREQIPLDLSISSSRAPALMSSIVYRDSQRQIVDSLQRLWTRYYQTLIDRVEQRSGGPVQLTTTRSPSPAAPEAMTPPAGTGLAQNPLVGVWTYVAGSQQFNGVAEPHQALLELWMENGVIAGRYRAELPDFTGDRKIDLRLRPSSGTNHAPLSFDLQSNNAQVAGQIVLEGPLAGGTELLLVRNLAANASIPRGREMLHRR